MYNRSKKIMDMLEKPGEKKTLKNVYENSVPSTSRESRVTAMVVYTENNSSDMEEPYSPDVSEYLPSYNTSRSSSPLRELYSPLPSSLIHEMIDSPQNNSESIFKFDTPLKMHSIVNFIASPLVIYRNKNTFDNSKELADDSDITSQVNHNNRIEGVKPLSPSIDISSSSIKENSLKLKNLLRNADEWAEQIDEHQNEIPVSSSVTDTDPIVTDITCNVTDTNNFDTAEATKSQPLLTNEGNFKPRKKKPNTSEWISVKSKNDKNKGRVYLSKKTKQYCAAKTMKDPCSCKMKCFEKFSDEIRKKIFDLFWQIGDHEKQWYFILNYTESTNPKVVRVDRKRDRTNTFIYFLPLNNDSALKTKVCKTMFINTLGIKERVVYTAMNKLTNNEQILDLRGKHTNRPCKIQDNTLQSVVQHIKSFPCIESHYLREKSTRQYLSENLNISKMYRLYKDWMSETEHYQGIKLASEYQYTQIFNTKFNLSFHRPKKDMCQICSIYDIADNDGKIKLQNNYDSHLKNKSIVRKIKDQEKSISDPSIKTVAVFDLEKVQNIPQSNVGVFHYKRKYPVYNFTVFDLLARQGHCYVWHAQIAKRGANEIASCLYHFIKEEANRGIKQISFYSDNCSGQNRNRFIFMYMYASQKFYIEIVHRFLQTGHTQNEGDVMHSSIEKNMKHKIIYTPDQVYEVITNSRVHNKFIMNEVNQSNIYDFKSISTVNRNWAYDVDGRKILLSQFKEIKADPNLPGKLLYKCDFEQENYYVLDTCNRSSSRKRKWNGTPADVELKPAYNGPLPISKALHKDLNSLCELNAIPAYYQSFFKNLTAENDILQDTSDED